MEHTILNRGGAKMAENNYTVEELRQRAEQQRQQIVKQSDGAEACRILNEDKLENGFSSFDMRARLSPAQVLGSAVHDVFYNNGCIPIANATLPHTVERKSVSINGKGRDDLIEMKNGRPNTPQDKKENNGGWFSGWF